jgi:hypothetical protein
VYNPASSQVDALLMENFEAAALTRFGLAGRTSAAIGRQSLCNRKLWFMASLC